ncbi:MAG: Cytidylate kinase [Planctomycetes bacterium ADurb.Bin126]|nr:MAG: Cytidylate kinase [Planctomycetes bacterium ADurb.Bin126]HOD83483.1 (d)CMP kinase [Phycisphaerae bacterium]HQL75387.1 (d)CMP kinase [Phycisphaerae bacterium]
MIITIDGPAGSGKSTAARNLAKALGIAFLDSGATYRAAVWKAMQAGLDLDDEQAVAASTRSAEMHFVRQGDALQVLLDGRDVTGDIRRPEVSENASRIARSPVVRAILVEMQRNLGAELGSFVTEGRDQGSVVFPHADVKFYLDASPQTRARRRCDELCQAGHEADHDEVLAAIIDRDQRDSSRSAAPLVCPDGAICIDTSDNTIEQTMQQLFDAVRSLGPEKGS